jgi:FkbM family methyltransferase
MLIARGLQKTYKIWSRILPSKHHAYKLPTGGKVYIDITESIMMFSRVIGTFEPQKHLALDFFLQKSDAFIDIGSNKGEFAIHAALAVGDRGKVVAFEPEPKNCEWIRKSIDKSGTHNVIIEEAAIGEKDGSLNLFIGEKSGWHSLVTSEQNLIKDSIPVSVYRLDKYLEKNPLQNIKVIKIDVEGFEKEVLMGAHKTLEQYDNLVILIDIHPDNGVIHDEIYEILFGHGFSLYKEQYPFNLPIDRGEKPYEIIAIKKNYNQDKPK